MLPPCIYLVCIAAIMSTGVGSQSATSCSNPLSRSVEFSVTSHKDRIGRWVTEVEMEHEDETQESGKWKIHVRQSTASCPGRERDGDRVRVTAKLTAPPRNPGPGYEFYRNVGYYKLHTETKTWHEARSACELEGTHLAILNSEEESTVLQQMMTRIPENVGVYAHIGFHDLHAEGQFLTIFDEPINATGFTRWSSVGQPDNSGTSATHPGEDCGSVHRNGGLNDMYCPAKQPFFCEQEIF